MSIPLCREIRLFPNETKDHYLASTAIPVMDEQSITIIYNDAGYKENSIGDIVTLPILIPNTIENKELLDILEKFKHPNGQRIAYDSITSLLSVNKINKLVFGKLNVLNRNNKDSTQLTLSTVDNIWYELLDVEFSSLLTYEAHNFNRAIIEKYQRDASLDSSDKLFTYAKTTYADNKNILNTPLFFVINNLKAAFKSIGYRLILVGKIVKSDFLKRWAFTHKEAVPKVTIEKIIPNTLATTTDWLGQNQTLYYLSLKASNGNVYDVDKPFDFDFPATNYDFPNAVAQIFFGENLPYQTDGLEPKEIPYAIPPLERNSMGIITETLQRLYNELDNVYYYQRIAKISPKTLGKYIVTFNFEAQVRFRYEYVAQNGEIHYIDFDRNYKARYQLEKEVDHCTDTINVYHTYVNKDNDILLKIAVDGEIIDLISASEIHMSRIEYAEDIITLDTGDEIFVVLDIQRGRTRTRGAINFTGSAIVEMADEHYMCQNHDWQVDFNQSPNTVTEKPVNFINLLREIGFYFTTNPSNKKQVFFGHRNDVFISPMKQSDDWTDLVDCDTITSKNIRNSYKQKLVCVYDNDSGKDIKTFLEENERELGKGTYHINDQNLENKEVKVIELTGFSASTMASRKHNGDANLVFFVPVLGDKQFDEFKTRLLIWHGTENLIESDGSSYQHLGYAYFTDTSKGLTLDFADIESDGLPTTVGMINRFMKTYFSIIEKGIEVNAEVILPLTTSPVNLFVPKVLRDASNQRQNFFVNERQEVIEIDKVVNRVQLWSIPSEIVGLL